MELNSIEKVYLEGGANYLKKSFGVSQGTLYVTSQRIVFCKRTGLMNALLGPLLIHLTKGKTVVFEIPLNKLSHINAEKHGFGKKYVFHNSNGQFEYLLFNLNTDKWLDTIKMAVETNVEDIKVSQIGELIEFKKI